MHEKYRMGVCGNRMKGGAVEWGKRHTLIWFGHIERLENEEFVKKMYISEIEGLNKSRPLGRYKDRVREHISERGTGRGEKLSTGVFGLGKVEALLLWPSPGQELQEGVGHQRLLNRIEQVVSFIIFNNFLVDLPFQSSFL